MHPGHGIERQAAGGAAKKLIGGIRYSLKFAGKDAPFQCGSCTERDRDLRNCHNWRGLNETAYVFHGMKRVERVLAAEQVKKVPKAYVLGDLHLYECPASWITRETGEMLRMIYLSVDTGALYISGGWSEQPSWFVEAVEIYRAESAKIRRKNEAENNAAAQARGYGKRPRH